MGLLESLSVVLIVVYIVFAVSMLFMLYSKCKIKT